MRGAKTHKDGVVTLTLCRAAKRNALSVALIEALGAMLDATRDEDMAVLVVRGAGNRAFASGGDLAELSAIRTVEAGADDRKGVGEGKSVLVRVSIGGWRIIKKKKKKTRE